MSMAGSERQGSSEVIVEKYLVTAFNNRLTDIQAAVGTAQLQQLDLFVEKRKGINRLYHRYFKNIEWISLPFEPDYAHANWQSYPVRMLKNAPLSQGELMQYLKDNGVDSIPGVMNAHQEKPYSDAQWSLAQSELARTEVILLPSFVELKEKDIKRIAELFVKLQIKMEVTT